MTQTLRQVSNPPEIKLTGGAIKISQRPSNGTKASVTFSGDAGRRWPPGPCEEGGSRKTEEKFRIPNSTTAAYRPEIILFHW